MSEDKKTYYDYDIIPVEDRKRKYCGAPRHGKTNVQAMYIERYASEELGIEPTESYSCEDCHDSMLQAFMDEMLPDATEEELSQN